MKRLPLRPASSGTREKMTRLSQSQVQTIIQQEIQRTIKNNEHKLEGLIEAIQRLEHGIDYESAIQKLEAQINTVAKRAEAALAYMAKTEKKNPVIQNAVVNEDMIKAENKETGSQDTNSTDYMDKNGELFQMMETTKKALKEIRSDNEAVKAAITDLSEELPPSVLTLYESPNIKGCIRFLKKEPKDTQEKANTQALEEFKEPPAKRVNVQCESPKRSNIPKDTDSQEKLPYPPLPSTPFPSILNMEAASYNIPQRPEVHVALIRDPPGLSVLWKLEKEDPCAAPMDSYRWEHYEECKHHLWQAICQFVTNMWHPEAKNVSVYITTEKGKGSGVFPAWKIIGEVTAIDLPMCVLIKKYKPGHKLCIAVVGKDVYNRYGPYSKVVTAAIPD